MNTLPNVVSRMTLRLLCAVLGIWSMSSICPAAAPTGAGSAVDQLKAAGAALDAMAQNPPSAPSDWSHAQELNEAARKFAAWQKAMLEERQEINRKQLKLFYQHMKIPPPLPPSQEPATETPMARLDLPLPLPTDAQLGINAREVSGSISVGAEGKVLSLAGASYKAGVVYAGKDNKWLAGDSVDFKVGTEGGPLDVAGTYQFMASTWHRGEGWDHKKGDPGVELSGELCDIKGALGYNQQGELSLAAGYDVASTPKAFSRWAQASIGIEAQIAAPVTLHSGTQGKRTLSGAIAKYSAKLAMLLTSPVSCPHCGASGQMDCGTCKNTRTVVCPKCQGELKFKCTRCEGGGELICGNCKQTGIESCSHCGGSGNLRCSTCGGSGQVTVYESETVSRQELVIDNVGFDESGNPIYERHYETRYDTVQVPRSQSCGSCGGSGDGGTCGSCGGDGKVTCHTCGGSGTVTCGRCGGSGFLKCSKCGGKGKVACPECRGKPIKCPLCAGKKQLGK